MPGKTDLFTNARYIQTISGRKFHLEGTDPEEIQLTDICHALGHLGRFTGHTTRLYTVAEHSILVDDIVRMMRGDDPMLRLQALLHDATEAYLADISAPFKGALGNYYELEEQVHARIADKFGLPHELDPIIKEADWIALFAEAQELQPLADLTTWYGYDKWGRRAEAMFEWNQIPDLQIPHAIEILQHRITFNLERLNVTA